MVNCYLCLQIGENNTGGVLPGRHVRCWINKVSSDSTASIFAAELGNRVQQMVSYFRHCFPLEMGQTLESQFLEPRMTPGTIYTS